MKASLLLQISIGYQAGCQAFSSFSSVVPTTTSNNVQNPSSEAFQTILSGEGQSEHEFFQQIWQKQPFVYRKQTQISDENNPFDNQVNMGLPGITHALENACQVFLQPPNAEWQFTLPIVSKDKKCLSLEELAPRYGNNLFEAYLDGCSILLNHNDRHCPYTAALCEDLQKTFPYVYANAYLTPPASQAVKAHADDRDVLVIQVYGRKVWKVYEEVPIEYPYTHEQVGKNDLQVPQSILDGNLIVDTVLQPGDVLYIPRGFVHEACTDKQENEDDIQPSYHITIALATFDWALSGLLATAVQKTLDDIPEYRMAVPVEFGMKDTHAIPDEHKRMLEQQVDDALEIVKQKLTVDAINKYLTQKYQWHANKSKDGRLDRISASMQQDTMSAENVSVVGQDAMKRLSMNSFVRASTREEYDLLNNIRPKQQLVRPETESAFFAIHHHLHQNPTQVFSVSDLTSILEKQCEYICDLSMLSFIRSCIERGTLALIV